MFSRKNKIEREIDRLLERMEELPITSPDYTKASQDLIKLTEALDNHSSSKSKYLGPTLTLVGQVGVTTALFAVEKNGVITSKIPDYVTKIVSFRK